jgi:alkyl hydroperoxide reductase subunit AhpF
MIPLQEQERIRGYFAENLTGGVKMEHFTQRPLSIMVAGREECRFCTETRQTLEELRSLSPKISLRVHELSESGELAARLDVDRVPSTIVRGQLNRPLRFDGFPGAGLFPPFVDALVAASRGSTDLDRGLKKSLQRLRDDVQIRLFVSPVGPFCPLMLSLVFALGLENQHLRVTVIEVDEFPRMAQALRLQAVPTTLIGPHSRLIGAVEPQTFLEQLSRAAEGRSPISGELLGTASGPATPIGAAPEPRSSPSGLILPGR